VAFSLNLRHLLSPTGNVGDNIFRLLTFLIAALMVLVVLAMIIALSIQAMPSLRQFGFGFLTSREWDPANSQFGALPFIYGTLASSLIALLISVPLSLGVAVFLVEQAPSVIARPLTFLVELLAAIPAGDVLDVGTGSGVIALLAVKLGAGRVCGTENDPVALEAARRGAALNGIPPERIRWALADPDELPEAPYQIVVANILLNTLVELAPAIARKVAPGGRLVLSGLLPPQAGEAEAAYSAQGLVLAGHTERDGWIRVELSRA